MSCSPDGTHDGWMTELKGQALSGGCDADHNDSVTSFMLLYELTLWHMCVSAFKHFPPKNCRWMVLLFLSLLSVITDLYLGAEIKVLQVSISSKT